ncbi:hypothetical protein KJ656_08450 [bacterium]|nr:hypothetical protein [bacterium]
MSGVQPGKNDKNLIRFKIANKVIERCNILNYTKCISERTMREFEFGWDNKNLSKNKIEKEKSFLEEYEVQYYHFGDETFDKIDGHFDNIESLWNNEEENKIAEELNKKLPGEINQHDRGILLDAIMNNCNIVINENWSDFNKMSEVSKSHYVEITTPEMFLKGH